MWLDGLYLRYQIDVEREVSICSKVINKNMAQIANRICKLDCY